MPDTRPRQLQLIAADGTLGPARSLPPLPRPRLAPLRAPERCIQRTLAGLKKLKMLDILPERMAAEMLLSLAAEALRTRELLRRVPKPVRADVRAFLAAEQRGDELRDRMQCLIDAHYPHGTPPRKHFFILRPPPYHIEDELQAMLSGQAQFPMPLPDELVAGMMAVVPEIILTRSKALAALEPYARSKAVRLDSLRDVAYWWPLLRGLARAYAGRHSLLLRRLGISPYWRPEPVEW